MKTSPLEEALRALVATETQLTPFTKHPQPETFHVTHDYGIKLEVRGSRQPAATETTPMSWIEGDSDFHCRPDTIDAEPSSDDLERYLDDHTIDSNFNAFTEKVFPQDPFMMEFLKLASRILKDRDVLKMLVACIFTSSITFHPSEDEQPATTSTRYPHRPAGPVGERISQMLRDRVLQLFTGIGFDRIIQGQTRSTEAPTERPSAILVKLLVLLKIADYLVYDAVYKEKEEDMIRNLLRRLIDPTVWRCQEIFWGKEDKGDKDICKVKKLLRDNTEHLKKKSEEDFNPEDETCMSGAYFSSVLHRENKL